MSVHLFFHSRMKMRMVTSQSMLLMTQTLKPRIRAGKRLPLSAPPILHRSGGARHSAMFCGTKHYNDIISTVTFFQKVCA